MTSTKQVVSEDEYNDTFLAQLRLRIQGGRINIREIAETIGEPRSATASLIYNGFTTRDTQTIALMRKLRHAYDDTVRPMILAHIQVIETKQYLTAMTALGKAMERPQFLFVIAEPGTGKSYTIREFKRRHEAQRSVVVVRVLNSDTRLSLMHRIGLELGAVEDRGKLTLPGIIVRLNRHLRTTPGILVLDEADRLTAKMLEDLRDVFDEDIETGKGQTSIVIFGNYQLLETVRTMDGMSGTVTSKSQLQRRIKIVKMPLLEPGDITTFFAHRYTGVEVTDDIATAICEAIRYEGGYGLFDEARIAIARLIAERKRKGKEGIWSEDTLTAEDVYDMIAKLTKEKTF